MSVGFAIISTTLNINGISKIKSQSWNIYFDNINISSQSINANVAAHIANESNTLVEYDVTLTKPGDYYEFTVDAVNDGTLDAKIDSFALSGIAEYSDYLSYTVTYLNGSTINTGDALNAHSRETYKIKVEYKNDINNLPAEDFNLRLSFLVTYIQGHEGIVINEKYTLTGTVYDDNGQPMRGGTIEIHSNPITASIDNNGQYTLMNVPIGSHTVIVKDTNNKVVKQDAFTLISGDHTTVINNIVIAGSNNGIAINVIFDNNLVLTTGLPKHKITIVSTNGESKVIEVTKGSSIESTVLPNTNYKYQSMACSTEESIAYDPITKKLIMTNINENTTCTFSFVKLCNYGAGETWTFNYTGDIQNFNTPCQGTYKLKVYGAQRSGSTGENGSYVSADYYLNKNENIYVVVGGRGSGTTPGYNGGVKNTNSGGGATHMSLTNSTYSATDTGMLISAKGGDFKTYGGGANYIATSWNNYSTENRIEEQKNRPGDGYAEIVYLGENTPRGLWWTYNYIGEIETFVIPETGNYKLEVYGGKGGSNTFYYSCPDAGTCASYGTAGYNGSAVGTFSFTAGETLYIVVGGNGGAGINSDGVVSTTKQTGSGGYNGGITGKSYSAGSGGATHIALATGTYSTTLFDSGNILVVAKGGSGNRRDNSGASSTVVAGGGQNYVNTTTLKFVGDDAISTKDTVNTRYAKITLLSN